MSFDWHTQVNAFLANYEGITHRRYRDSLAAFQVWYAVSYNAAPDAKLLTDEEVRDYRAYLTGFKGYKAATVNAYLAPLRAIVRDQGRMLGPLDPRDAQRIVAEAARIAGVKVRVTPHALRHYFATRFLERNQGDIATLATVLGHANISTTTRYLHPNAQRVQAMVEQM